MRPDLASMPPEVLSAALERHEDYRILRRIAPMRRNEIATLAADMLIGCAVSIRTTGPEPRHDAIVELTMQRFWADASGRIVILGRLHHWSEVTRNTARTAGASMAAEQRGREGHRIWEPMAAGLMLDADFVVTHNARFCRPFMEARLPIAAGRPWVCTLNDVDWNGLNLEGRSLSDFVMRMGWFHDADGVMTDVDALLHLLDYPMRDGTTVIRAAVDGANSITWLIEATGAPYQAERRLRRRGYVRDDGARLWSLEVADDDLQSELQWATIHVYGGRARPSHRRVSWAERYVGR